MLQWYEARAHECTRGMKPTAKIDLLPRVNAGESHGTAPRD